MTYRQNASTGELTVDSQPARREGESSAMQTIRVKIASPFKIYFDDDAFSISGENTTGSFDILPQHHNFVTLLSACDLNIRAPRANQRISISGGLMHVRADSVTVFLNI